MTETVTTGWNLADTWEVVAEELPDAPALVHGKRRVTWAEFDHRADGIALTLLEHGAERGDKVANYLYNCPEYLEVTFAATKVSLVLVNTNYRYLEEELVYLWDNADAAAIVFHGTFTDRIEAVRNRLPKVRLWLWVDNGSGVCPAWAMAYEEAAQSASLRVVAPWERSPDDLVFIYTGGTTGMPKGVMWRQEDLYRLTDLVGDPEVPDVAMLRQRLAKPGLIGLPGCPMMHGTGFLLALSVLDAGGCVVTLPSRHLDIEELFTIIERERVERVAIVGDAFARPMLAALDAEPDRWDLSCFRTIITSGAMCSEPVKQGLVRHLPQLMIADLLGSSEAIGIGLSVSGGRGTKRTASFRLGVRAKVVTDDGRVAQPGEMGMLAIGGPTSLGYYKDAEKTAKTFLLIDGERHLIPGDFATVEMDGTVKLLGRGSVCINTGGEKVFPEEIEEVLKEHASVRDAIVVGIPHERFGETICAVVEPEPGTSIDEQELVTLVKGRLAAYKAPRHVWIVSSVGRNPNGKADYPRIQREAAARFPLGAHSSVGIPGPTSARAT